MHGCFVRSLRGRVGLTTPRLLFGFALALVAAVRVIAEVRVPLPQLLIEAEQALSTQQSGDAAGLLDKVLARVAAGEPLPPGLAWDRLQLAAANAHFQNRNPVEAQRAAEVLLQRQPGAAHASDARMILGLSLALQQKFVEALPVFAALEAMPAYRDRARLYRAMAAQEAGQIPIAIDAYTRLLASAPRDEDWADAALVLVSLHLRQKELDAAARGLRHLQENRALVDNLAGLNALCLQLGDACLEAGDAEAALTAYRLACPRERLVREQEQRAERMQTQLALLAVSNRRTPSDDEARRRLEARVGRAQGALSEIEKATDYDAALFLRLGHGFLEAGAPWEAALAFDRVLKRTEVRDLRAKAHRGLVRAQGDASRFERAEASLEAFAREMPEETSVLAALYGLVMSGGAQVDPGVQRRWLERAETLPGSESVREPLVLLHAQALLTAGRLEEARLKAGAWAERFPKGALAEDAAYLHALAGMLAGRQERALRELASFLKMYPGSRYEDDAAYRIAAAHIGLDQPTEAQRGAEQWLATRPEDHPQRGEVLALLGDAQVALGESEIALESYRQALRQPLPDELLGYVLDEITKLAQALGRFGEAAIVWSEFAEDRPDHPFILNAAYWIGRMRVREGKINEALESVGRIAGRHLEDPAQEGVERLLGEVAGLLTRNGKERVRDVESLMFDATRCLGLEDAGPSAIAHARLEFLRAELAARAGVPEERAKALVRIADGVALETLSPALLGMVGDCLVEAGRSAEAWRYYERLVTVYPGSVYADFGYAGLAERAFAEGRPAEALLRYDEAIDKAGARNKLREVSLGRARALLALERFDEAREAFSGIASEKAWRGEATAESVFSLGEILFRQGGTAQLAQAQAYYQRVFLSYRKFNGWVMRAYVRSAETFARLGRLDEAVATLRECLRDERLLARPEAGEARVRLADYEAQIQARTAGTERL